MEHLLSHFLYETVPKVFPVPYYFLLIKNPSLQSIRIILEKADRMTAPRKVSGAAIPGLDYSRCPNCQSWIIEPPELARIESERAKAKPGKETHRFYSELIKTALEARNRHESGCL